MNGIPTAQQLKAQLEAMRNKVQVKPTPPAKPAGWWALSDLTGSVAGVLKAIEAAPDVPRYWKDAIIQDVTAQCGTEFNSVYVDAHYTIEARKDAVLHLHITPAKML